MFLTKCNFANLFSNKNSYKKLKPIPIDINKKFYKQQIKSNFSTKLKEEYLIMYSLATPKFKDIGLITINNQAKRNSFCLDMTTDLIKILSKLNQDFISNKSPKVIILATEGECFSAGHDLSELSISTTSQRSEIFGKFAELALLLKRVKPIIIAEVQGLATAAGCQLASSCDLIVASSNSKFEMPGVKIGLFPQTPAVPLVRLIGSKRAMQMLLTSEPIGSANALEWGLVNEIVDVQGLDLKVGRERIREASLNMALKICQFSVETLRFGKQSFYARMQFNGVSKAYELACKAMVDNLEFADCKEGIKAFLEKKKNDIKI